MSHRKKKPASGATGSLFGSIRSLFSRSASARKRHRDDETSTGSTGNRRSSAANHSNNPSDSPHKRQRHIGIHSSGVSANVAALSNNIQSSSSYNSVTEYLLSIPSVVVRAQELLSQPPVVLSRQSTDARIINVLQGEVAHATCRQADILVSDHATTCHILAIRSRFTGSISRSNVDGRNTNGSGDGGKDKTEENILASICHIDQPGYDHCIREIIELHKAYHRSHSSMANMEERDEKKDSSSGTTEQSESSITIELHLVGGFNDCKRSSHSITNHLMELIGRIAAEEQGSVGLVVETCAVSSLNDNGSCSPIGRGLAINIKNGNAYLASVDASVMGPAVSLRNSRLWAGAAGQQLTMIHSPFVDHIIVEPFYFEFDEDCEYYSKLSNKQLLRETSTSPDVEEDDYCNTVRDALRFMRDNIPQQVFGIVPRARQYKRSDVNAHEWIVH